jgi:hypothetical protein
MSFFNAYVVISPNDVHLGIVAAFDKGVNHVVDAGEGCLVFDCVTVCYNMVRTPTLCKPDTSDRPLFVFSFNLLNLATPLL